MVWVFVGTGVVDLVAAAVAVSVAPEGTPAVPADSVAAVAAMMAAAFQQHQLLSIEVGEIDFPCCG